MQKSGHKLTFGIGHVILKLRGCDLSKKCGKCEYLASGMRDLRHHWQLQHTQELREVKAFLNKDVILAPIEQHERLNSTPLELLPVDVWMKR